MSITKLIGFKIYNHYLFKDGSYFGIDISGQDTQKTRRSIFSFSDTVKLNKVTSVVGINAVGKTMLINIFSGLSDFYLKEKSIDQTLLESTLKLRKNTDYIKVEARIASDDNKRYVIQTIFKQKKQEIDETSSSWYVEEEAIYSDSQRNCSRKNLFNPQKMGKPRYRSKLAKNSMLSPKDSYFKSVGIDYAPRVMSTSSFTNLNIPYHFSDKTPESLLGYLDNSIDYLRYNRDSNNDAVISYSLKFKGSDEVITSNDFSSFSNVLSSGTIKGISLFFWILGALRSGSTIIVDEIEIHINKQIARDFIGLFMDPKTNKNNASIIYTTHYMELTNDLQRKDQEYVISRNNDTLQSSILRLSDSNARSELKNSELFESGSITNTQPDYEKYIELKSDVSKHVKELKR